MGAFQDILHRDQPFEIAVDYYDKHHASLLATYPNAKQIQALAGTTIQIPAAEFLTYSLFVNKRDTGYGLNSYSAIKAGLDDRMGDFNDGLSLTPTSLCTVRAGNEQLSGLSEKIGVGISLSTVGAIHRLTEADWERIPVGRTKSMDFRRASDGYAHVWVECKGTSVPDNTVDKVNGGSSFAKHIRQKKEELKGTAPGVTAYGTIGAIDTRRNGVMKCWLLDPEGQPNTRAPIEQQVLNRLFFIAEILETVLPQSPITVALYKRLTALLAADPLSGFNKEPLLPPEVQNTLLHRKLRTVEGDVIGIPVRLKDGTRVFYGMQRHLVELAIKQDFGALLEQTWKPETTTTSLTGLEFAEESQPTQNNLQSNEPRRKQKVELATLHTTSAGRVFGLMGPERATAQQVDLRIS